ncbi:MAG: DNA-binding protein [Ruminococcaceae bacterium]|nr:DNA-binding protein [Oscillospiraceae bacterium]
MFKKDMHISLLLDFYGDILSERRRELTGLYYNDDLSLSEIAEISGISRQGVRDAVKKSEAELLNLEEKLGLAGRYEELRVQLANISRELGSIELEDEVKENRLKSIAKELSELNI